MGYVEHGLLLREHSHRVANDMTIAIAALRHAERQAGGDVLIAMAIGRLEAAARVQRLLCEQPSGTVVDLLTILRRLCEAMRHAHAAPALAVEVVGPPLRVDGGDAWTVSLIVHELVGNALRHGGRGGGRVRVEVLGDAGGGAVLAVTDRGAAREWSRPGGQGAGIVDGLVARLGGVVSRSCPPSGGRVQVVLPCFTADALPLPEVA
ncbi:ATP-binding protein [Sphingomonas adhaesiva]|uniref:ATP-binding protein n=1 Tax=Sphingomonas adhaesiva TaxID=28212 RepID=UPI00082A8CFA|nr:sensor histidine kinase [Sphingomonas adhaesiva]